MLISLAENVANCLTVEVFVYASAHTCVYTYVHVCEHKGLCTQRGTVHLFTRRMRTCICQRRQFVGWGKQLVDFGL